MIALLCELHRKEAREKYQGMTIGERMVAIACEPEPQPCEDCKARTYRRG